MLAAFPLQDGQQGMLVLHGARVVGLDLVSRAPQYAELHDKLLRSYAFEALVRDGEPGDRAVADAFLERIADLPGSRYKSPGLGWDVRYEGGGVLGSALTYRGHAVHAAFFDVGGVRGASDDGGSGGDPRGASRPRPDWRIADARERARRRQAALKEETMTEDTRQRAYRAAAHITREQLRRDDPERARILEQVESSDVVVVAGIYDHVESVLGALDVPHLVVQPHELDRLALRPEQLLIVNCPGQISPAAVRRVRAFVEAGGSLFTTDWALKHVIEPAFPGVLAFDTAPTRGRRGPHRGARRARTSTCRACSTARTTRSGGSRPRRTPSAWSTTERVEVLITSRELGEKYGERRSRCGSAGARATCST